MRKKMDRRIAVKRSNPLEKIAEEPEAYVNNYVLSDAIKQLRKTSLTETGRKRVRNIINGLERYVIKESASIAESELRIKQPGPTSLGLNQQNIENFKERVERAKKNIKELRKILKCG